MNHISMSAYVHFCFDEKENTLLFEKCPIIKKDKHQYLYKPDDIVQTVYYIKKGTVKLFVPLPNGSNRTISHQREGSIIGLVSSFSKLPSLCYCETIKPCEFLSCPIDVFWKRLQKYDLAFKYISLESKKACLLQLRLAFADSLEFVESVLEEGLTQQEIADMMGYSRVQVARICSQIKKRKTVKKS